MWATHGDLPRRIDHTGVVGAGVGLTLAGALAGLVVTTDTSLGNSTGWFIWLVLYPLSPLLGYDLGTRGADGGGPLLRAGGYWFAVAAAHVAMAAGIAVCVGSGVDGRSTLWYLVPALCVLVVAPARAVAVRAGRDLRGGGWGLMGAAAFLMLLAWFGLLVAMGVYMSRVDS